MSSVSFEWRSKVCEDFVEFGQWQWSLVFKQKPGLVLHARCDQVVVRSSRYKIDPLLGVLGYNPALCDTNRNGWVCLCKEDLQNQEKELSEYPTLGIDVSDLQIYIYGQKYNWIVQLANTVRYFNCRELRIKPMAVGDSMVELEFAKIKPYDKPMVDDFISTVAPARDPIY